MRVGFIIDPDLVADYCVCVRCANRLTSFIVGNSDQHLKYNLMFMYINFTITSVKTGHQKGSFIISQLGSKFPDILSTEPGFPGSPTNAKLSLPRVDLRNLVFHPGGLYLWGSAGYSQLPLKTFRGRGASTHLGVPRGPQPLGQGLILPPYISHNGRFKNQTRFTLPGLSSRAGDNGGQRQTWSRAGTADSANRGPTSSLPGDN